MRPAEFTKLIGLPVGLRRRFETGTAHFSLRQEGDTLYFRRGVRTKEEQDTTEHMQEIVVGLLELNLIKAQGKKKNRHDEQIYSLTEFKMKSCSEVARHLQETPNYVYNHFPRNVLSKPGSFGCEDCHRRALHIGRMNKLYVGLDFAYNAENIQHPIFTPENVDDNIRYLNPETGRCRKLTAVQKETFFKDQRKLEILDDHFLDKEMQRTLWNDLLVETDQKK